MKKHILLLSALTAVVSIGFSQEKGTSCAEAKSAARSNKSNTFTRDQILLTEKYDAQHYFIDISMSNAATDVAGTSTLTAKARVNLDTALLELHQNLSISAIRVDGNPVQYSRRGSGLYVPVNKTANQTFKIAIDYAGTPPTAASNPLGGGGMTNATSQRWGNKVTWSLSEPFSAFEWFPVKQSLRDKLDSCRVHLTVPTACKGGSNGVLDTIVDLGNGTHRFEWNHNYPIDYYLISVAVAEYVEYNVTANPVNSAPVFIQNFIYNNPATLTAFKADIDRTAKYIEHFSTVYGPYPFANEKYGHCMAPLGGGMEHQTMTTQGTFEKNLTAHELGHQWWGDHVTCATWSDIWVNEGFASYSEYVMLEKLFPNEKNQWMLDAHTSAMSQASGSVWVADSLNTNRIFSSRLTYDKGAAIVHTLRYLINNDSLFYLGLRTFQSKFSHKTAIGLDFKKVMEEVTKMDFTAFFNEWYFGEGYPTYSAKWFPSANGVEVEINQTTSVSGITPFFTNDLDVTFSRTGAADTTIRLKITGKSTRISLNGFNNALNLKSIDAQNWITNKQGSIVKDANMVVSVAAANAPLIEVFPNPVSDKLIIRDKENLVTSYVLIDPKGKVVANEMVSGSTVDFSSYSTGTYLIQLNKKDGTFVRRVVQKM